MVYDPAPMGEVLYRMYTKYERRATSGRIPGQMAL